MDPEIDFLAGRFYVDGARDAYRWLRHHSPVHLDERNGLWGIARYDDVLAAERDPRTFSSAGGSRPETGPLPWMIDMDGADHSTRRKLVSAGFTPARVRAAEPHLRDICDELIDRVCERGACDFVHDIAAPLPMIVIGDMLGVAPADRDELLRWSHGMLASLSGEPEGIEAAAEAFDGYVGYAHRMIADRRADPRDDLFSVLVHATVDGDRLDDDEIVFESLLLLIGGDETTRQVSAGGMEQLLQHPDQWQRVRREEALLPSAVEEMLRWVSPIKSMARTTTGPVELAGVALPAGAKVLLLYESADFDDRHFPEPERFDIERSPNDHLAFGFGPHFCLGAGLARSELRALFERVLRRMPDLELATTEPLPRSVTGIAEMPVVFSPSPPVLRAPTGTTGGR
ncbi:MAG TPA: cytochrome P450 [Acidimicrobiales bacterium]|nr:cytochrome P450 [Acidimicrobiales bacterium]